MLLFSVSVFSRWYLYFYVILLIIIFCFSFFQPSVRPTKIDHQVIDGHVIPNHVLFTAPTPNDRPYNTLANTDNFKVTVSFIRDPDNSKKSKYFLFLLDKKKLIYLKKKFFRLNCTPHKRSVYYISWPKCQKGVLQWLA